MGLMDEIAEEQQQATANRCPVNRAREQLSDADYRDLLAALDDPTVPGTAIQRALGKHLPNVGIHGLSAHRKGTCACAR
jgi:hypothetical protein